MEELQIPVEVINDIGEIYSIYGVSTYKTGDIFMFDPNHSMHIELEDSGYFKQIDNSKCDFYSLYPDLNMGDRHYDIDEKINVENISDDALTALTFTGRIRKELKTSKPEKLKENNKKKKVNKTFKYKDVAKALSIKFSELKKKANALNIEIADKDKKIAKKKMNEIIEALK